MAIITISKAPHSGVEELAQRLAETLGYRLFSREELLARAAEEFGALQSQLESALTHTPGLLEGRGLKRLHFIWCAQATMARAVQDDDVVYHGEAGHLLLEGIPHQLRVRIVASMELRIQNAMSDCHLSRSRAIEYLRVTDEKLDNWMRWLHGVDARDPYSYDLMINLERVPVESARTVIAETAARDFQTTPASRKVMADLTLASTIRAHAGLDPGISDDRLVIEADDGVVTVTAGARHLANAGRLQELVERIPGVAEVRYREGTVS